MRDKDGDPGATSGGRHLVRHGPSRRWLTIFSVLLALAVVAAGGLAYAGIKTVRSSRAGQSVSVITDPAAPGFEAFLEPTPTLAIVHRDGLSVKSIAVAALRSGDDGGSLLLVSPEVQSRADDPDSFNLAADAAFATEPTIVVPLVQELLGFGIVEVAVVEVARWAELVAPVAPIELDNPVAIGEFPAGRIALQPEQVGRFLGARDLAASPREAVRRQRAFYTAWLGAIGASDDPAAVPGEVESGIGRFMRGLGAGPHRVEETPVLEERLEDRFRLEVDAAAMEPLVAELVPYPTAAVPGGRIRVRLLDGTGDARHVQVAAPLIVPAGAEIVVVGNAEAFDYRETEVRYHNPVVKAPAGALLEALGAGRLIEDPRQTDAFDVTIVLGPDV